MVSKTYEICNAYESGYGHGYQRDGKNGDYFTDDKLNEAYKIGYDAGVDASSNENKTREERITRRAWEVCLNIYKDYSRGDTLNFSTSIQRAWKAGKEMDRMRYK